MNHTESLGNPVCFNRSFTVRIAVPDDPANLLTLLEDAGLQRGRYRIRSSAAQTWVMNGNTIQKADHEDTQ